MHRHHERQLRVYVETSVINHLDAPDRRDWMADTIKLWERMQAGVYDVVIGTTVMAEIERCPEPKKGFMLEKIDAIDYSEIPETDESTILANKYVMMGGLPKKSSDDATHIALATLSSCDVIVSWNFSHIVNVKAMAAVDAVNLNERLKLIRIVSPTVLLGDKA